MITVDEYLKLKEELDKVKSKLEFYKFKKEEIDNKIQVYLKKYNASSVDELVTIFSLKEKEANEIVAQAKDYLANVKPKIAELDKVLAEV